MNVFLLGLLAISTLFPLTIIWFAPERDTGVQVLTWQHEITTRVDADDELPERGWEFDHAA